MARLRRKPARSGRPALVIVLLLFLAIGAVAPTVSATNHGTAPVTDRIDPSGTSRDGTLPAENGTTNETKDHLPYLERVENNSALSVDLTGLSERKPKYGTYTGNETPGVVVRYDVSTGRRSTENLTSAGPARATAKPSSGRVDALIEPRTRSLSGFIKGGTDDRVEVADTAQFPYRSVVQLRTEFDSGYGLCSGALVDSYHVLTAGHCIYDGTDGFARSVAAYPGATETTAPFGHASTTAIRVPDEWTASQDRRYDYALLTLDRPIGKATGWMGRTYADPSDPMYSGWLHTAGYPGDKCGVYGYTCDMYRTSGSGDFAVPTNHYFYLDAAQGQSGSPVWVARDGRPYIISVLTAGRNGEYSNLGSRIGEARSRMIVNAAREDEPPESAANVVDDGDRWASISRTHLRSYDDTLTIRSDVRNIGTKTAATASVIYYLSTDRTLDGSDYDLGTVSVADVEPFADATLRLKGQLPAGVPDGTYHVIRRVSGGGQVSGPATGQPVVTDPDDSDRTHTFSERLTLDRTGPAVSITRPSEGDVTGSSVTVSGTASTVSSVDVSLAGRTESVPVADGAWTTTFPSVADGRRTITASASDGTHETTRTRTVLVDATAPDLRFASRTEQVVRAGGDVSINVSYGDRSPEALTVSVKNGTAVVGRTTLGDLPAGSRTRPVGVSLADGIAGGRYDVVARLSDAGPASNATVTDTDGVLVDVSKPAIHSLRLNRSVVGPGDRIDVAVNASDDTGVRSVSVSNSTLDPSDGNWTGAFTAPTMDGHHSYLAIATDGTGRYTDRSFTFSVDATAPKVGVTAPAMTAARTVTVRGTVTDENGVDDVVLTYDGSEASVPVDADGTYATTVTLPEGETAITATATDEFGNTNASTTEVVVDRTAPTLERHSPPDYVDTRSPVVSITPSDDLAGVNATLTTLRFDGADVTSQASADGPKLIYRPTNLSDGTHTITASATDLVGNEKTENWTFTVDTTGPWIDSAAVDSADGVSPDDPLSVSVEASDDTGVASVTAAGTALHSEDGKWTGRVTPALALGGHELPVVVHDRAGNVVRTTLDYTVGHERDADLVAREAALDPAGPELRRLSIRTKPGIDARTVTVTSGVSERNPAANLPEGERSIYFAQINTSLANDDINDSRVRVRVSRSELAAASLDAETVRVWVAEGGDWRALETTRLGPNESTLTYSAAVPHFSTFAVTARDESVPPTIEPRSPDDTDEVSPTAPIIANYSDADSGIDASTARLFVDGIDVTGNATVGPAGLNYATTFEPGKHHVRVSVNDTMGNNATRRWDFVVEGPGGSGAAASGGGGGGLSPPSVLSSAAKTGPDEVEVTIRNGRAGTESRTSLPDFGSPDVGYDSFELRFARDDPKVVMRLRSTDAPAPAPGGTETFDYLGFAPRYATAADVDDVTVRFTVGRDALPTGSTLDDVVVHAYREGTWIELDVPREGTSFEATDSDLSTLAIGVERRASVSVTRIDLPGEATVGAPTGITATVANTGSKRATADVTLWVDGTALTKRSVDVGPGEESTVSFEHTFKDAGDHRIAVNDRSETVSVAAADSADSRARSNTTPTPITQSKTEGQDGFGFLLALFSVGLFLRRSRR